MPALRRIWPTVACCFLIFLPGNFLSFRCGFGGEVTGSGPAGPMSEMLSWLPPDTETVVAINGPLRLEGPDGEARFSFQRIMERLAVGEFVEQRDALILRGLVGKTVCGALKGSRCFRGPRDIGAMPYEGCEIILFTEDATTALAAAMQSALDKATRRINIGRISVAVFVERREKDIWTFFFAQPKANMLLCATHEGYLRTVLERIANAPSDRAMPPSLHEWKHVTTAARVWGIRHYSKAAPEKDPTSPLQDKAEANTPDPQAVGLTLSYHPQEQRVIIRYLTHSKTALDVARAGWWTHPDDGVTMSVEQTEPGVVQITATLDRGCSGNVLLLMILAHLGHAVYL